MYERQEGAGHGKYSCRKQKDAAWSEQTSQVDAKGPDKHDGCVISAVEPCTFVVTNADVTLQICKPQRKHATGKSDESGAYENPENT